MRRDGVVLTTQTVENFQRRDPDPDLFTVPAGYSITTVELKTR